jgi:hypothetical protein
VLNGLRTILPRRSHGRRNACHSNGPLFAPWRGHGERRNLEEGANFRARLRRIWADVMSEASDPWFVRFPDGRVVRAASASVVRQQLTSGRIPLASSVRRSPGDEWTALQWTREFADILGRLSHANETKKDGASKGGDSGPGGRTAPDHSGEGGLSARLDRTRLPTIGVRGMMHELLAALDSTLVRKKLAAAALAGLAAGLVTACVQLPVLAVESAAAWVRWVVAALLLLLIFTAAAGMLTRMTFMELSRMRPARFREGARRLAGTMFRIAMAQLLTAGFAGGLIALLRWIPDFLLDPRFGGVSEELSAGASAVDMILEIALWPIIGFALLLPPIIVVEHCGVSQALGHWVNLLRADLGRVFLYEALALGLGLAATLLLALPWLALFTFQPDARTASAVAFTRTALAGLAAAPLLAYLMVANVFIYINLRYESAPAGRR